MQTLTEEKEPTYNPVINKYQTGGKKVKYFKTFKHMQHKYVNPEISKNK